MMTKEILLLAGDGIGPEIMQEAKKVLSFFSKEGVVDFKLSEGFLGGAGYDETGDPLPSETVKKAKEADAVLLAAIGGPKWDKVPFEKRPEAGLLGIRKEMGLFANLRPAIVFEELAEASTLKKEIVSGLDILILRELIGGIYFGKPAGIEEENGVRKGFNTLVYSEPEIKRIAKLAFELSLKRNKKLCSVDKANVLQVMVLWREVVESLAKDYPEVSLSHMYVDNAAMQLVRNPKQFDVIVTGNMFGDILSDCASMLTGSLGMLPSASLGEVDAAGRRLALYEPVHGSAPDIAGKGIANPLAQILSVAMMFKYSLDMSKEAEQLENAVKAVLKQGLRTKDIMQKDCKEVGTVEMGDAIIKELEKAE
ncbi:MAG: 3-isopropylmalate dehydrogenase [Alphaproteobacteria bacterium]